MKSVLPTFLLAAAALCFVIGVVQVNRAGSAAGSGGYMSVSERWRGKVATSIGLLGGAGALTIAALLSVVC
jgi:hypothetical protein